MFQRIIMKLSPCPRGLGDGRRTMSSPSVLSPASSNVSTRCLTWKEETQQAVFPNQEQCNDTSVRCGCGQFFMATIMTNQITSNHRLQIHKSTAVLSNFQRGQRRRSAPAANRQQEAGNSETSSGLSVRRQSRDETAAFLYFYWVALQTVWLHHFIFHFIHLFLELFFRWLKTHLFCKASNALICLLLLL